MGKTTDGVITIRGLREKDLAGIYRILFALPGLNRAAADTGSGRIVLAFDPRRYGLLTAVLLLREAGFPAVLGEHG